MNNTNRNGENFPLPHQKMRKFPAYNRKQFKYERKPTKQIIQVLQITNTAASMKEKSDPLTAKVPTELLTQCSKTIQNFRPKRIRFMSSYYCHHQFQIFKIFQ